MNLNEYKELREDLTHDDASMSDRWFPKKKTKDVSRKQSIKKIILSTDYRHEKIIIDWLERICGETELNAYLMFHQHHLITLSDN